MIVKTEAIVLRTMKYRESSKIVTLYTRHYGKMTVIAKGCRGPKSKFGSALEPMNYVLAVLYKKDDRDLHLLSQCDLMKSFRRLSEDMERMYAAMTIVALIEKVTHPEEKNEGFFTIVENSLDTINTATQNASNVLYKFEVSLLAFLGFTPNFHACSSCGAELDAIRGAELYLEMGGLLCGACAKKRTGDGKVSGAGLRVLQQLQQCRDLRELAEMSLEPSVKNEVCDTLQRYLRWHVEDLKTLKSDEVFAAIL